MMTLNASRRLSLVLMLVLGMLIAANPGIARAASFTNGTFDGFRGCNLTGWTQTETNGGAASAVTHDQAGIGYGDDCMAKIHVAKSAAGNNMQAVSASIKQTFTLEGAGWIGFYLYAHSSNGFDPGANQGSYMSQTIRVLDSNGTAIYNVSRNTDWWQYGCSTLYFPNHVGQDLTIEFKTQTSPLFSLAPSSATLYVDVVTSPTAGCIWPQSGGFGW